MIIPRRAGYDTLKKKIEKPSVSVMPDNQVNTKRGFCSKFIKKTSVFLPFNIVKLTKQ